ncbi:MAG TPA: hypothetical protein VLT84_00805, partial [Acidobacteriota bacterium]|nr:hypothetical protein [Acidobacteriota bacterium]
MAFDPIPARGSLRRERILTWAVVTAFVMILFRLFTMQVHQDLIVMPGGDIDTWRPWKDRYKVRFDGRTGYARTALRAGVPVVPIAHAGSHETLVVLTDGRRLARRLGLRDIARAEIFPIHLSFPFGLTIGPVPHIPVPVCLRYRVAPPVMPVVKLEAGEEPSDDAVREMDRRVRDALQAELDVLAMDPRTPLDRAA